VPVDPVDDGGGVAVDNEKLVDNWQVADDWN